MPTPSRESPAGSRAEEPVVCDDPVFVHSRREAKVILAVFGCCLVWSIGVCAWLGYRPAGEESQAIATVLGIPAWVFWGIAVPWLVVDVVTILFCRFFMVEDDLYPHEAADREER